MKVLIVKKAGRYWIRALQVSCMVMAGFCLLNCQGAWAQGISVQGRVMDIHGQPIASAKAELLRDHGLDSTNNAGEFAIVASTGAPQRARVAGQGRFTLVLRKNLLVFENSEKTGIEFEMLSLNGRRVFALKRPELPAGIHRFACSFNDISFGIYIARIRYSAPHISKAELCLPSSGWLSTTLTGERRTSYSGKTAFALDTLMVYKRGFKIAYIPIEMNPAVLGDVILSSDSGHKDAFILFARDSFTDPLPPTSGWEFDAAKGTFTKRHDFGPSSWAPSLLLSQEIPEYVRHQVNTTSAYDYGVLLYKINYCTWNVDTVYRSSQINGLGADQKFVYLDTYEGKLALDRQTGRIDTMGKFNVIARFNDIWLIDHGRNDTAYLFRPSENRTIKTLVSSKLFGSYDRYLMSPDTLFITQFKAFVGTLPFNTIVSRKSEIIIFRLDNDSMYSLPLNIYTRGGSGVPVIYLSFRCWFSIDGRLNYFSAVNENDTLALSETDSAMIGRCELVTVDLSTKAATKSPATAAMFASTFNPPFWPVYLESLRGEILGESQLVSEFEKLFGIISGWGLGISPDGKRFLNRCLIPNGPSTLSPAFIYGDMENKWVEPLPDPAAFLMRSSTEMYINGIADTCDAVGLGN